MSDIPPARVPRSTRARASAGCSRCSSSSSSSSWRSARGSPGAGRTPRRPRRRPPRRPRPRAGALRPRGTGRSQPVTAVAAKLGDINVVQTALGTVLAARTSTVHSRVDGLLLKVAFTEGDLVAARRLPRADRPGAVPGRAGAGRGAARARRGHAQQRAPRPRALPHAARAGLHRGTAGRPAGRAGEDARGHGEDGPGAGGQRQAAALVHAHHRADRRAPGPAPGRRGQHRPQLGCRRGRGDHAGESHRRASSPSRRTRCRPVLARLRKGEKPAVDAWDRDQKELLSHGSLVSTDNQIDVTTGTVKLKAEFPNPDGKLFPNQFVNVRMVVDTHHDVVDRPLGRHPAQRPGHARVGRWATTAPWPRARSPPAPRRAPTPRSHGPQGRRARHHRRRRSHPRWREGRGGAAGRAAARRRRADGKQGKSGLFHKGEGKGAGKARRAGQSATRARARSEPVAHLHHPAGRHRAADGGRAAVGHRRVPASCRSRRCPRSTIRPSRSSRSTRAPAPTSSPPRSPRRSSASSARCRD